MKGSAPRSLRSLAMTGYDRIVMGYEELIRLSGVVINYFNFWKVLFQAAFQLAPADQNAVIAGLANQPNICSKPHHFPLEPTTRVFFAQRYFISNLHFR